MPKHKLVEVPVRVLRQTEKAWLVESERGDEVWVPKSVCELDADTLRSDLPCDGTIKLPEKWAIEKELA